MELSNYKEQQYAKIQAFISLIGIATASVMGLFLFQFFGLAVAVLLTGFDLGQLFEIVEGKYDLYPNARIILLVIQGFTALGMFLVLPFFYVKYVEKTFPQLDEIIWRDKFSFLLLLLTIILVFSALPFISYTVHWNENLVLPSFLADFEQWAILKEQQIKALTIFLTDFQSDGEFMLALFVVAVIPAVGEEFLFRGIIQQKLKVVFGNIHVAIWLTGFLFSAFHFQFYGLIPRMLLGVLFGYIFYWSNSLWLPILAHFINNGYMLTVLYFFRDDFPELTLENTPAPEWHWVVISIFLTAGLLSENLLCTQMSKFRA